MSAPLRILLTGAGGCVGRAIIDLAAEHPERYQLSAVFRSPPGPLPAGVRAVRASLEELPALLGGLGQLDACIHAAAAVHDAETDPARIFAVNRDQTLALARALGGVAGFARFVFISTQAVLEQAAARHPTPYAASKGEAEQGLAALAAEGGFELSVLRLATVYGPHDRGNIGALYRAVARRRYVRIAPASTAKTLVSARRAAAAALAAAQGGAAGSWLVADARPYPLGEVEDALAQAAGVPPSPRIPALLGWAAAAAGSALQAVGGPAPLTLRRLRTMARPAAFTPEAGGPLSEVLQSADARPLATALAQAYAAEPRA
jgi:UDP-glucose 4-epimerase